MAAVPDPRRPDPDHGVFETLLVLDGRPVELDAHLTRLADSLAELFPDRPAPDLSEFDPPVEKGPYGSLSAGTSAAPLPGDDALSSMRVTVAPNRAGELEARIAIRPVKQELVFDRRLVALHSLPLAGGLGAHKWADRRLLDQEQSRLSPDALPLVVDRDGTVLEASRANVFAVRDGALFTPPTDGRILPGVTRMRAIEVATAAGLETREAELSRESLLTADEVFLTGSVRGVERVRELDGIELSERGGVDSLIATELRRNWISVQVG